MAFDFKVYCLVRARHSPSLRKKLSLSLSLSLCAERLLLSLGFNNGTSVHNPRDFNACRCIVPQIVVTCLGEKTFELNIMMVMVMMIMLLPLLLLLLLLSSSSSSSSSLMSCGFLNGDLVLVIWKDAYASKRVRFSTEAVFAE